MTQDIHLRPLRDDDDISVITALLHEAYAPLAKLGFRFLASHQDDGITAERLREGWAFVGELSGRLVATATLRACNPRSPCAWYREPHVFTLGQFAVLPAFQRGGIGLRVMQMMEHEAAMRQASELALDTAEGATHLCRWYARLGYRFVQHVSWPETNYRSVVLSKRLQP